MVTHNNIGKLARALIERSKRFSSSHAYDDALLDIGAAYHLLVAQQDPQAIEIYRIWQTYYEQYSQRGRDLLRPDSVVPMHVADAVSDSEQPPKDRLQSLLGRVQTRRQIGFPRT